MIGDGDVVLVRRIAGSLVVRPSAPIEEARRRWRWGRSAAPNSPRMRRPAPDQGRPAARADGQWGLRDDMPRSM